MKRNTHLFLQKQCMIQNQKGTDLKIYLLKYTDSYWSIGYLKKMTRDVNLFLLLLFLHILEPHIILINNSYKIMQKVQEMSGKQTVCIFQKDFLQHAILKAASSLQGKVILLLIKKSSAAKNRLRKPGFFH